MKARVENYDTPSSRMLFEIVVAEEGAPDGDVSRGLYSIDGMFHHLKDTEYTEVTFTPVALEAIHEHVDAMSCRVIELENELGQWRTFGHRIKDAIEAAKEMDE